MNKNNSLLYHTACLSQCGVSSHKYKFSQKILDKTTIASLDQAEERVKYMQKRHKWRKQRRLRELQQTYDENCRLFLSINSQKSIYAPYRSKLQELSTEGRSKCNSILSKRYENQNKIKKLADQNKKSIQNNQKLNQSISCSKKKQKDNYRAEVRSILRQVSILNKLGKDRPSQKKNFFQVNSCLKGGNRKFEKYLQLKQINKIKNTYVFRLRSKNQICNRLDQKQIKY